MPLHGPTRTSSPETRYPKMTMIDPQVMLDKHTATDARH
jgi:hypothetical protein